MNAARTMKQQPLLQQIFNDIDSWEIGNIPDRAKQMGLD